MEKIDFCWKEYLERDVSLFEEVETAAPNIIMKYVYPDSLLNKLPAKCHGVCRELITQIKYQHGDLYSKEEVPILYPYGTRTIKFKNIANFIERSLRRLLFSEEKSWHPLFTSGMVKALTGFFREIVTTPPDQNISVDLKRLRRPAGNRWGNLPDSLMSEVRDSQAKFLFHYFMSYLRKFFLISGPRECKKMILQPMDKVIASFSQENCKDLIYKFVKIPSRSHFDINDRDLKDLIQKCSFSTPRQLTASILGPQVFDPIRSESRDMMVDSVGVFIQKHRRLCAKLAALEWLSPDKKLLPSLQLLLSKIDGVFYSSIRCLYTRFNLEVARKELVRSLQIKSIVVKQELFTTISVGFNPEPLPFIDNLGEHLGRRWQTNVSEYQQSLFYNSLYFYYFYTIHWIRRIAYFAPSVLMGTHGHQLWWREEADVKRLLDQANGWAVKGAESKTVDDLETADYQEGEDESRQDEKDEAANRQNDEASTSHAEEPEVDSPHVARKRKRAKSEMTIAESGGGVAEPGEESAEKKKKKKKRKRGHSSSDEVAEVEAVEPPKDNPKPRAKKRNSEPEIVTLSSDDEAELTLHQWEDKWMAQMNHLSADPKVPALIGLILQTLFENSKRIRLELKNLQG